MSDDTRRNGGERRILRLVFMWVVGTLQSILVIAVTAGVGALWSLQNVTSQLVVKMSTVEAKQLEQSAATKHNADEIKRVSDEEMKHGARIDNLERRK